MTWLERQVRFTDWRQVGLAGLVVAATIGLLAYNRRYLTNYFEGPRAIGRDELLGVTAAEDIERYWVTMKPDRTMDTGVDLVTVRKKRGFETGRSVTGHLHVGVLGDKLMIIKTGQGARLDNAGVQGALLAAPDDLIEHLTSAPATKPLRDKFMPIMLDTSSFKSDGDLLLTGAGLASGLAALIALFGLYRVAAPGRHGALRRLAAVPGQSLDAASRTIESDVADKRFVGLGDGAKLTTGHLVHSAPFRFNVQPLSSLLWTYPVVTTRKLYGVITTGRSHSAVMNFERKPVKVKGSEQQIQSAMSLVAQLHPWVLVGHDQQIATAYKRKRRDLITLVAGRRSQVMDHVAKANAGQDNAGEAGGAPPQPPATG